MTRRTKTLLMTLALGLLTTIGAAWATEQGLGIGDTLGAEALALPLASPLPVSEAETASTASTLADHWGENGVMVVFAANVCPYVQDWLDRLPRMADFAVANDIGFVVVNANARRRTSDDSPEAMAALAAEHGFDFPYLIDRDARLADALGAMRTPEVFLFDGDKTLVYQGAIDDRSGPFDEVTAHWALDALRQMSAGDSITTPSSAAIGCSVLRPRRRRPPPGDR